MDSASFLNSLELLHVLTMVASLNKYTVHIIILTGIGVWHYGA